MSSGLIVVAVLPLVGVADMLPTVEPRVVLDFSFFSEVPTTPVFRSTLLEPKPVPAVPVVELARAALPPAAPVPETPLVPAG